MYQTPDFAVLLPVSTELGVIDDLYQSALAALTHHLDEASAAYKLDDGEIIFDGHRLGLSITFEGFVEQGPHTLAPLDIQIHVDGDSGDRFRVGALGVGTDRDSAVREGLAEWHLSAVAPLLAALGAPVENRRASQPRQLAGWDFFAGRIFIRGGVPPELRAGGDFYRALLERLRQVAAKWERPTRFELRSIYVMASCSPGGSDIQAAVDGLVSEELAEMLRGLTWPSNGEAYLFKQLFVFRNAPSES
jgi:hypothetical protein